MPTEPGIFWIEWAKQGHIGLPKLNLVNISFPGNFAPKNQMIDMRRCEPQVLNPVGLARKIRSGQPPPVQYASNLVCDYLDSKKAIRSMSRKGNFWEMP